MRRKKKRRSKSERTLPVDEAMRNTHRIAPDISFRNTGDPVQAMEMAARREEGMGRHGFRSLIPELD